jgi:nicotinate-nucleotide adenylyltransferase
MVELSAVPLGIFGGTFDPVHFGHLRFAEEAWQSLGLSQVMWLPAGQPRHRDIPAVSAAHRLAMVRLAVAGRSEFCVDGSEAGASEPSYTVLSLQRLRGEIGSSRSLVLLLGADAFLGLPTWHRWQDLFDLAHIGVGTRPGNPLQPESMPDSLAGEYRRRLVDTPSAFSAGSAGSILYFPITSLDIKATYIRDSLAINRSARYLLPDAVLDYISQNRLYRA